MGEVNEEIALNNKPFDDDESSIVVVKGKMSVDT